MKNIFRIIVPVLFLITCSNKKNEKSFFSHKGFAAGTTFLIEYDKNAGNLNDEIDKVFKEIGGSLSFTDSSSFICRLNQTDSIGTPDIHFINVFNLSKKFFSETKCAYDPTMYPLTKFWEGDIAKFKVQSKIDTAAIDSLRKLTGFGKYNLKGNGYIEKISGGILNFEHVYHGYMADKVAELFNNYNVSNYRIEIGGMINAKGLNAQLKPWQIGIDEPVDNPKSRQLLAIATLDNTGYSRAGSYRKFYTTNGMKFSYTIDPLTGYPVDHTLIEVSVFAPTCAEAEAYSHAFLVMGLENTKMFLNTHPGIEAYLISTNYKGEWISYITDGLKNKLEFVKEENPL